MGRSITFECGRRDVFEAHILQKGGRGRVIRANTGADQKVLNKNRGYELLNNWSYKDENQWAGEGPLHQHGALRVGSKFSKGSS